MRTTFAYWIRGAEFAELAALSIASVKKVSPYIAQRRIVICTDEENPAWLESVAPHGSGIEVQQLPAGRPAMVANLDAQVSVICQTSKGERVLFLDADTIMLQPFPWTDADLHVTWRADVNGDAEMARQQPYNYGVLGANVTPAAIEAFIWLRARILRMQPERQQWYGNQLALEQLLGQPNRGIQRRVRWTLEDQGMPLSVCELPCDVWNFSPDRAEQDVTGKGILHMKGGRKDLMARYSKAAA